MICRKLVSALCLALLSMSLIACGGPSKFEGTWDGRASAIQPRMAAIAANMPMIEMVIGSDFVTVGGQRTEIRNMEIIEKDDKRLLVISTPDRTVSLRILDNNSLVMAPDTNIIINFKRK